MSSDYEADLGALFREIIAETEQRISRLPPGLDRFEKTSLLEGMRTRTANRLPTDEVLLMCESLVRTLGADSWMVEKARDAYIASKVVEEVKSRGFAEAVQSDLEGKLGIGRPLLEASLVLLCKEGMLVKGPEGSYLQTPALWSEELGRVRGHLQQLLGSFEKLALNQRSNFEDLAREYRRLLTLAKQTSEELRIFNQPKVAQMILRRSEGEERHLDKHHPGPWIPNMAREYHSFLGRIIQGLPTEFSGPTKEA